MANLTIFSSDCCNKSLYIFFPCFGMSWKPYQGLDLKENVTITNCTTLLFVLSESWGMRLTLTCWHTLSCEHHCMVTSSAARSAFALIVDLWSKKNMTQRCPVLEMRQENGHRRGNRQLGQSAHNEIIKLLSFFVLSGISDGVAWCSTALLWDQWCGKCINPALSGRGRGAVPRDSGTGFCQCYFPDRLHTYCILTCLAARYWFLKH